MARKYAPVRSHHNRDGDFGAAEVDACKKH